MSEVYKASPIDIRKSLELAHSMVKEGINFIPVAVFNDDQKQAAVALSVDNFADVLDET